MTVFIRNKKTLHLVTPGGERKEHFSFTNTPLVLVHGSQDLTKAFGWLPKAVIILSYVYGLKDCPVTRSSYEMGSN